MIQDLRRKMAVIVMMKISKSTSKIVRSPKRQVVKILRIKALWA
jgi:hypothetical protein